MIQKKENNNFTVLLFTTLIISICSIIYELIIGSLSSYLLGDSVKQFSITIGLYLSAMGIGSYISKFVDKKIFQIFISLEILVGVIGGLSSLFLFMSYIYTSNYELSMYTLIIVLGILVGLEIPLLIRIINENDQSLKVNIANLFAFDYLGGLVGSLVFPIILLPKFGFITVSFLVGTLNISMAILVVRTFKKFVDGYKKYLFTSIAILVLLIFGIFFGETLTKKIESGLYRDKIIFSKQTLYQKIIMTKHKDDVRVFLDGNVQFSSKDEYRYHECIVHIPFLSLENPENILILGGGDGLALREVLKYPSVKKIDLVDIDEEMVNLCMTNKEITQINLNSLTDSKVNLHFEDAFIFLNENKSLYDCIIIDLPDPNTESLNKLYTVTFYQLVEKSLKENGIMITQSISPYYAKDAYWCIYKTISEVFTNIKPFHLFVPSFGDWGFHMASKSEINTEEPLPDFDFKYLNDDVKESLFHFSNDETTQNNISVNTILKPKLIEYYDEANKNW